SSSQECNTSPHALVIFDVLYLLDSYGVSVKFYHELSMPDKSLPRSYKVKNLRKSISSSVNIQQLEQGCEINDFAKGPQIIVEDNTYELQFILGGDYKFLLLLLGFNAENANYLYSYCTIKKDK
uniref:Uncharacterized protein n=1 Tax=Amphimedon queenslandica TaxID=400682 RepID=A0A1X7UJH7_AMPQE